MSDDALRNSVPYSLLARILRKVQGVRDAETFAQVDVGEEVMRLRDAFTALRDENARLRAQLAEVSDDKYVAITALLRHGFRRCDIPACNCGSWHHVDGLMARWRELEEALEPSNGQTMLGRAREVAAQLAAAKDRLEEARGRWRDVQAWSVETGGWVYDAEGPVADHDGRIAALDRALAEEGKMRNE